ncbi:MAG: hypothetical protein HFF52_03595 [Lawsonibacter sp.]|nr:hypothetical protein [Lawsonibacter sp.]
MKTIRRIPALLLAMLMLCSAMLTSCGKKQEIAPADQVAVALFDLILKDDAKGAVELFGYADEAEARKDMGLEEGIYDDLADQMVTMFASQGVTATAEDAQKFVDAFLTMFKNVKLTAKVKEADEKAGTAVVTCTINTFDSGAVTNAMNSIVEELYNDPDVLNGGDMDAVYSTMLNKMSEAIANLTPTENTKDFDVDFVLEEHTINGKKTKVWLPKDANAFGAAISTNAMGG